MDEEILKALQRLDEPKGDYEGIEHIVLDEKAIEELMKELGVPKRKK